MEKETKKQNKSIEKEIFDWLLGKDLKKQSKDNKPKSDKIQKTKKIQKMNALALTGFILGLASIFLSWIGIIPILAIIFSAIGIDQTKKKKEKGKELAIIGLILGIIYTIVYLYQHGHLF